MLKNKQKVDLTHIITQQEKLPKNIKESGGQIYVRYQQELDLTLIITWQERLQKNIKESGDQINVEYKQEVNLTLLIIRHLLFCKENKAKMVIDPT